MYGNFVYENAAVAWKVFGRYCVPQKQTRRKKATRWWTSRCDKKSAFSVDSLFVVILEIVAYITFTCVSFNARCLVRDVTSAADSIYNVLEPVREKNAWTRMKIVIDAVSEFYEITKLNGIYFYIPIIFLFTCHIRSFVYTHFSRWRKFLATLAIFWMVANWRFAVFRVPRKY